MYYLQLTTPLTFSELQSFVSLRANHYPPHKETSLMRSERSFNLWYINLEDTFSLCVSSRIIVEGPVSFPTMGSWPNVQYQVYVSSMKRALHLVKEQLVASIICCHYCTYGHMFAVLVMKLQEAHSWVRALIMSPMQHAEHSLSGHMETSQQRGRIMVGTNLISICPVTEVCGVFSNRVLPPSFSGN